jgi:small subunit ribosomal protein S3
VGQKVNPVSLRLGIIKDWNSKWFAQKDYQENLHSDLAIRKSIKEKFYHAGIAKIEIERAAGKASVNIYTARPGIIIGRKGAEIDNIRRDLMKLTGTDVAINIKEVRKPEANAQLIAENIATQLERRVSFRRAMKKSVFTAMKLGVEGVKISCAGRLGGTEMARREWYREGRVPLHTLRADIDYGTAVSKTTYGIIGIKVWVFNGEVLPGESPRSL